MEKLLNILWELHPEVDFSKTENLIDDGILDSFDIVTLVAQIDDQFNVQLSPEDLVPENFNSATALYALICRLKT